MRLPQNIEGVCRKGRSDAFISTGLESSGFWGTIKSAAEKVGEVAWDNKCLSCYAISNPIAAFACQQACEQI